MCETNLMTLQLQKEWLYGFLYLVLGSISSIAINV